MSFVLVLQLSLGITALHAPSLPRRSSHIAAVGSMPFSQQPGRAALHEVCMKTTAKAAKGFGAAVASKKKKKVPIVHLAPEVASALETLESSEQSIRTYLNPKYTDDPAAMKEIADKLQSGDVVVLRDAFRPEFAEMVYSELMSKDVAWELNEAYFPDGCKSCARASELLSEARANRSQCLFLLRRPAALLLPCCCPAPCSLLLLLLLLLLLPPPPPSAADFLAVASPWSSLVLARRWAPPPQRVRQGVMVGTPQQYARHLCPPIVTGLDEGADVSRLLWRDSGRAVLV